MDLAQTLKIDGSLMEGGGQILRNATALAAITGRSIQIDKIRAGRQKPGLSPQHLTGLQLVASITQAALDGAAIRSTSISFAPSPRPPTAGSYEADTKTAGSCTLMVQQSLPVLLFAAAAASNSNQEGPHHKRSRSGCSSCLTLKGGTDAAFAPPIGYLQHVFLPTLQRLVAPLGAGLSLRLLKRGFYPKGGGVAQLTVLVLPPGTPLPAWQVTGRGHLVRVTGWAVTAGKLRPKVGQRMATAARQALKAVLQDPDVLFGAAQPYAPASSSASTQAAASAAAAAGVTGAVQPVQQAQPAPASGRDASSIPSPVIDIEVVHEPPDHAVGDGGSIVLVAETSTGCLLGASALAERGVTAEAVGAMAARDLLEELRSGAAVDQWCMGGMQDQLVIFMALAKGRSSMLCGELTLHTRTAISIAQQVLPQAQFSISTVSTAATAAAGHSSAASQQPQDKQQQLLYVVQCTGAGIVAGADS